MNRQLLMTFAGVMMILICIEKSSANVIPEDINLRTVSASVNQFSTDLYKNITENNENNLICSPLSVSMVLSMTSFGARGETENEMRSGLQLPSDKIASKNGFQSLIDSLNSMKKIDLRLANKVFTNKGFVVEPEFKEITKENFRSEAESLDFSKADDASKTINDWCEEKTNHRIKDIVQADDVKDASMVLINAVYFKGQWEKEFDSSMTINKPFNITKTTSIDVPMMSATNTFNYGTIMELDAKFVEIAYVKDKENKYSTSMFIILPNTVEGLKNAESNLDKVNFKQLHKNGIKTDVILTLPKFKIESTIELKPILEKMGMRKMFTNFADFSGISKDVPLKISKIIQKAFIEVNEQGSEAAAVTASIAVTFSLPLRTDPPIIFEVNRPFLYAIVEGKTGAVLFQGHVNSPKI